MFKFRLSSKTEIEPQEIFLDKLSQEKEKEIGLVEKKLEVPLSKIILVILGAVFFALILLLFAKTFQLQVVRGEDFRALAQENKFMIQSIKAERGIIYDKNFNQLVWNQPSFDLICRKALLPEETGERSRILKEVSQIIKVTPDELRKKIEENNDPSFPVLENLDHQTLIILKTKLQNLPGFEIKNNTVRDYKDALFLSHLLGYKRKNNETEGLEAYYNEVLKENPGKVQIERDAKGKPISKKIISFPQSGNNLVLWLDSDLEKKIYEELEKSLERVGAKKGIGVALDPKTGGVMALVSLPSYDNNLFSKGMSSEDWEKLTKDSSYPLINRVISGTYPTGSTIKPLIASAALEEGIITEKTKINCQGKISIQDRWQPEIWHDFLDWKIHGLTDVYKAIAQSCNVFFYTIGGGYKDFDGLGPTKIKKWLGIFGWGEKTGIDLLGEEKGFLPDEEWKKEVLGERWYDGDTYHFSIGQGYLEVTPLQVVNSFAAIANGGTLYKPKLGMAVVDSDKNIINEINPEIIRQGFVDPENLKIVREGMRRAVASPEGSAFNYLSSLPVCLAAKTGTAQTGRFDSKDGKEYYDNWITVFGPCDDPQIVLTIMVEDVKIDQTAALPVAKGVLEWYFGQE